MRTKTGACMGSDSVHTLVPNVMLLKNCKKHMVHFILADSTSLGWVIVESLLKYFIYNCSCNVGCTSTWTIWKQCIEAVSL